MIDSTVETQDTVKVNGISDADKLYKNAKFFMELGEVDRAEKVLEEFINLYPNDYRGWWGKLELSTDNFTKVWPLHLDFVKHFTYAEKCCENDKIKQTLKQTYENWYMKRYDYLCNKNFSDHISDEIRYALSISDINENELFYEDGIKNAKKCNNKIGVFRTLGFDEKFKKLEIICGYEAERCTLYFNKYIFVNGRTAVIEYVGVVTKWRRVHISKTVNKNLDKYIDALPNGNAKDEFKGGCYIATAVYGSYNCPEVRTLRRYRDNILTKTWYGRAFIHTYYAISPTLVKWFGHTEWFKKKWKSKLDKMVAKLQLGGIESTPYEDKEWRL